MAFPHNRFKMMETFSVIISSDKMKRLFVLQETGILWNSMFTMTEQNNSLITTEETLSHQSFTYSILPALITTLRYLNSSAWSRDSSRTRSHSLRLRHWLSSQLCHTQLEAHSTKWSWPYHLQKAGMRPWHSLKTRHPLHDCAFSFYQTRSDTRDSPRRVQPTLGQSLTLCRGYFSKTKFVIFFMAH